MATKPSKRSSKRQGRRAGSRGALAASSASTREKKLREKLKKAEAKLKKVKEKLAATKKSSAKPKVERLFTKPSKKVEKLKKKPAVKKPAVKKPAVKKPAVKKPAVKKPAVKKPAVKKPAVKKPAVKKPAVKKPAVKKPVEWPPKRQKKIVIPREVMQQKVIEYYDRAKKEKKLPPKKRDPWFQVTQDKRLTLSVEIGIEMLVSEETVEEIIYTVVNAAIALDNAARHIPGHLIYATLHLYEYGTQFIGSPSGDMFEDDEGIFIESFQGTPGLTLDQFIVRFTLLIERMADMAERSAVMLRSVTLHAYPPAEAPED